MEKNESREEVQPDPEQANVTPPEPVAGGIETANGSAHDAERKSNPDSPDVASIVKQAEWPMIILTAIIAFSTLANVVVYWCESESASKQTQKLIDAANVQACAAQKNADSAASFATSAAGINQHTDEAVGKFERMAKGSEDSISEAKDALRLDQRAWVGLAPFKIETNKGGVSTNATTVINSGKSPARKVGGLIAYCITVGNYVPDAASEQWMQKMIHRAKEGGFKNTDRLLTRPINTPGFVNGRSGGGKAES